MKRMIIAGASGMVGNLILEQSLSSSEISEVISLVRKPSGLKHSKLKEVTIPNFADYTNQVDLFQNIDAAHFCIGAYTGQVPDELFKKITVDYAYAFAKAIKAESPNANLCLLSGAGADRKEKSRTSFTRYKGMAENLISALDLQFHTFRPAYIYPVTPRKEPNFLYRLSRTLYPLIKMMGKNSSIKSTELAAAMFKAGMQGADQEVLENHEILDYLNA